MFRKSILLMSTLFVIALASSTVLAQRNLVGSGNDVLPGLSEDMPEVIMYAEFANVSPKEAVRRLQLQKEIDDLHQHIRDNYTDTFAGIYIEHKPEYKVVVQFANKIPDDLSSFMLINLGKDVEIHTVAFSQIEVEEAREKAAQLLKEQGLNIHSATSPQDNIAEIYVSPGTLPFESFHSIQDIEQYFRSVDSSLADRVRVIAVDWIDKSLAPDGPRNGPIEAVGSNDGLMLEKSENMPLATQNWQLVRGGAKLYYANMSSYCTAGFPVWKGTVGKRGISTAGHCWQVVKYFTYIDLHSEQFYNVGPFDVGWSSTPGWQVTNQIDIGTWGYRTITVEKWRWQQYVGEWVCKYGRSTGPGCTSIISTDYDGVNISTNLVVQEGDSGGPWWSMDSIAHGTTISRREDTNGNPLGSVYAPIDQLYQKLNVRPLLWP